MMCSTDTGGVPVGVRMSESGNSSKFEVSSMLLISIGMAAGLSLKNSQRTVVDKEQATNKIRLCL